MGEKLDNSAFAFIGCGVMGESIVAGLLQQALVTPDQIVASHPRENRRRELEQKYDIQAFSDNAEAVRAIRNTENSNIVLSVKPQRITAVLRDLSGVVLPKQNVISIVAGAKIETIATALKNNRVVRAMPNTPAQIGAGITAWTCTETVGEDERSQIRMFLSGFGKELYVETENMIDMATALSATGPTYVFMVMEALTDAGVHLGFSREMAKELVQEMMLGSIRFAIESNKHPAELRNMVTSPGGTSAEAIYQMEKGTLRTVLSKAVYAAYTRAVELGKKN